MTAWMLWAIMVSVLLGAAAHLLEWLLRASGREARWTWAVAMIGATTIHVWSLLAPGGQGRSIAPETPAGGFLHTALDSRWNGLEVQLAPAILDRLDLFVAIGWLAASTILLTGLLGGLWRLNRRAATWPRRHVADHEVLVSEDFGPALLGLWSPRIVLPSHLVVEHGEAVSFVCLHEAQHRAARDTWLLGAGALIAAALPWNAGLWWQVTRLRAAVELDCDKRVLDAGVTASRYAHVLLSLGTSVERHSAAAPAFLQPPALLERRLTMLINGVRRKGPVTTTGALAGAALLTLFACEAPAPTIPPLLEPSEAVTDDMPVGLTREPVVLEPSEAVTGDMPVGLTREPVVLEPSEAVADDMPVGLAGDPVVIVRDRVSGGVTTRPLIVVDGVILGGSGDSGDGMPSTADLDAMDIESIEVIKGVAAVELYGPEASAGVISITLKSNPSP